MTATKLGLVALLALTVLRLLLAASLPLSPDEAYYFVWTAHVQPGYFDHPPMVAFWIKAGTLLAGKNPLGVRLLGPLAGLLGSVLLWRAGEDLFPGRRAGLVAAALLNATLLVGVGTVVMTPDTPLFFFWVAGIAALGRLIATGNPRWWLAVGIAAGLALLSKYTALLFIAAVGLWLLSSARNRITLRTPWPWAGLALALLVFVPNIIWNAEHRWVSYFKQGGRVAQLDLRHAAGYLVELVLSQAGLITPIIFVLFVAGIWRLRRLDGPAASLLLWLTLLPGAVFLQHIVSGRVEANWPAILYPSACLATAALPTATLRRWLAPALALGVLGNALVYAQARAAVFPLPAAEDPAALQLAGWQGLTNAVQAAAAANHLDFIASDEYAALSEFLIHSTPSQVPILGIGKRWRYFGFAPPPTQGIGILVTRNDELPCTVPLGTVTRARGGEPIATFKLCLMLTPSRGVILPRP